VERDPVARSTGRLFGVGSVVVDVLATVPALPARGGDVWASRMRMAAGGGFHALAAAARQGVDVVYAGAHGTGPFGDLARAALRAEGIAVRLPPRPDVDTGVVIVVVDDGGERTFVSGRGAETTLGAPDLADLLPAAGDVVLVSGYGLDDALAEWVSGLGADVTVAFDPGPLARAGPLATVRARLDWLSANAAEATALTGAAEPASAARLLGGRAGAVVRTGAQGCVLAVAGAEPIGLPAVPVTAVDTTGAGDVHTGAFLAALLRGTSAVEAARAANAVASAWVATGSYSGQATS
jgi:sugar/nucleoside kinase (ribokinase family)